MSKNEPQRRGIQSVEIGMRVLYSLASAGSPASLTSLSKIVGISTSQAFRYLTSLVRAGVIKQNPESGLYELSGGALRIGLAALNQIDALSEAEISVNDFVKKSQRTTIITVMSETGPTIVRWFWGEPRLFTPFGLGATLPLFTTSTGRIFFAFGDHGQTERLIDKMKLLTPDEVPTDLSALGNTIRQQQYAAMDDGYAGLRSFAAPVFDLQGQLIFSVATLASSTMPQQQDKKTVQLLLDTCKEITHSIGGKWPEL